MNITDIKSVEIVYTCKTKADIAKHDSATVQKRRGKVSEDGGCLMSKNSRIVKRWQFGQKVEIGELAGKRLEVRQRRIIAVNQSPDSGAQADCLLVQGDDQAVNVGKY